MVPAGLKWKATALHRPVLSVPPPLEAKPSLSAPSQGSQLLATSLYHVLLSFDEPNLGTCINFLFSLRSLMVYVLFSPLFSCCLRSVSLVSSLLVPCHLPCPHAPPTPGGPSSSPLSLFSLLLLYLLHILLPETCSIFLKKYLYYDRFLLILFVLELLIVMVSLIFQNLFFWHTLPCESFRLLVTSFLALAW